MRTWLVSNSGLFIAVFTILLVFQFPVYSEDSVSVFTPSSVKETVAFADRNEQSTPRDSVLPVSPAIAPGRRKHHNTISVKLAKSILLRLGYQVGRLDDRITAKFKTALFRYQRAHGLPSSGYLDKLTLQSLRIINK